MKNITRKEAIKTITIGSFTTSWLLAACKRGPSAGSAAATAKAGESAAATAEKHFFTNHEMETVTQLANLIIPADKRSGNAESAGVPAYIDYMMTAQPEKQTQMRGGLNWLDAQCQKLYGNAFVKCTGEQQKSLLDQIAYPSQVKPEVEQGAAFFNEFRAMTAAGFWSSKIGIEDLQYKGNQFVAHWDGCPDKACNDLGVNYGEFNTKKDAEWLRAVNNA